MSRRDGPDPGHDAEQAARDGSLLGAGGSEQTRLVAAERVIAGLRDVIAALLEQAGPARLNPDTIRGKGRRLNVTANVDGRLELRLRDDPPLPPEPAPAPARPPSSRTSLQRRIAELGRAHPRPAAEAEPAGRPDGMPGLPEPQHPGEPGEPGAGEV